MRHRILRDARRGRWDACLRSAASVVLAALMSGGAGGGAVMAQIECGIIAGQTRCPSREMLLEQDLQKINCRGLWELRNTFFKARGYCFKTPEAAKIFGNDGCEHHNDQEVPFNTFERENVKLIRQVETAKACRG